MLALASHGAVYLGPPWPVGDGGRSPQPVCAELARDHAGREPCVGTLRGVGAGGLCRTCEGCFQQPV